MTTSNQPSDKDDVSTALGLLRDSLAEEELRIRNEGAKAMQGGEYDTATSVIEFAKRLLTFQKKVESLVSEWDELEDLRDTASPAVQEIVSKRFFGKEGRGNLLRIGFIDALLGMWVAGQMGLPELFTINVGGTSFPIIWSILGSAILVAVLGLIGRVGKKNRIPGRSSGRPIGAARRRQGGRQGTRSAYAGW